MTTSTRDEEPSFVFISYTKADQAWATWIGSVLESAGLTVRIQAWDSSPGANFVVWMQAQISGARWTVAVYSAAYFDSKWCTTEWTASLARQTLLPVRIEPIKPPPPLDVITWVDLFGLSEERARQQILRAVEVEVLPRLASGFPGSNMTEFPGPGPSFGQQAAPVREFDISRIVETASEDLGSEVSTRRLAAIYTLESLATTSESKAMTAIVCEILASHTRRARSSDDRVAAVRALSRIHADHPIDLNDVDLSSCNLKDCNFENVNFRNANLSRSDLTGCILQFANLDSANLRNADLRYANSSAEIWKMPI